MLPIQVQEGKYFQWAGNIGWKQLLNLVHFLPGINAGAIHPGQFIETIHRDNSTVAFINMIPRKGVFYFVLGFF